MAHIPAQVSALLQELKTQLPVMLGRNLVGIYLYGSLTQRAFKPKHSDVDLIVVTRRDLSAAQFRRLDAWLKRAREANAWAARLQMSFLIRDQVLTMNAKACLYQFGQLKRSGSDGNPIIWLNVLRSGVVLHGPPPESFVPEITPEIFLQALAREVGYLRAEICEQPQSEWRDVPSYRVYAVLTLCRILYSHRHGTVVSKQRAAKWALETLPARWHALIRQALASDESAQAKSLSRARIATFIEFAEAQLRAAPMGVRRRRARIGR
ncbi:MAG TPA: aminoglycoside adenylyltransferase domain-containing protein [Pyrinomonadaceae bacterium]|nr:aminoglycoside adenylyltransferase domain-containing protein [Pyrinomonadaceae bacterium]